MKSLSDLYTIQHTNIGTMGKWEERERERGIKNSWKHNSQKFSKFDEKNLSKKHKFQVE